MPRVSVFVLVLLLSVAWSQQALAQDGEDHDHEGEPLTGPLAIDPAAAPLVQPDFDDFIADDPSTDPAEVAGPVSMAAYTEVGDKLSVISLAPRYRINRDLRARVRVPWVLQRKLDYSDHEATASGLGDISVDLSYRRNLGGKHQRVEFTGSVKLPTGDDEHVDDEGYYVPLGTGSVDLIARGQYARQTKLFGLLVSALYRINSSGEVVFETPWGDTRTTRTTNANQFVAAGFGRYRATEKIWVHLGAAITMTGSGETETETVSPGFDPTTDTRDLQQGSTLLDFFPGVSYSLGLVQPYLGLRIPVITSYDYDSAEESRDLAVVLQVTYSPTRMFGN